MSHNNTENYSDAEYDKQALTATNKAYSLSLNCLGHTIFLHETWSKNLRREGRHKEGYPYWFTAQVYTQVYLEKEKVKERNKKITEVLTDCPDTEFLDSI